jgi:hypothetical protein
MTWKRTWKARRRHGDTTGKKVSIAAGGALAAYSAARICTFPVLGS